MYLKEELALCLCVSLNDNIIPIYEELLKPVEYSFLFVSLLSPLRLLQLFFIFV